MTKLVIFMVIVKSFLVQCFEKLNSIIKIVDIIKLLTVRGFTKLGSAQVDVG